jgi:hypothetical protein
MRYDFENFVLHFSGGFPLIKEIQDQFHDGILAAAAERYGKTQEALKSVGGFESYVYEYDHAGQARILNALTKDYVLSDPAFKRQEWDEEDQLNVRKYLPEQEADVIRYADELMARIRSLPKDRDSYGLIHTDLRYSLLRDRLGVVRPFSAELTRPT